MARIEIRPGQASRPTEETQPAEELVEIDGPAPAEYFGGEHSPVLRVPPPRFHPRRGRHPPVVRDAQQLAGETSAHGRCLLPSSYRLLPRRPPPIGDQRSTVAGRVW